MIELRTLGTIDLRDTDSGRALDSLLAQEKRSALLFYLALASPHGPRRRDELLGLFWSELPERRARAALRQSIHVLRRELGPRTIHSRGSSEVGTNPAALWCDVTAFKEALHAGELLPGFHLTGSVEFERWLEGERVHLRDAATGSAWDLAAKREQESSAVEAAHWARRAVYWSPWDEAGARRLIELLERLGDRSGAVREYEAFRRRLERDLEIEPGPEIRALGERLAGEARAYADGVDEGPSDPSPLQEREEAAEAWVGNEEFAGERSSPPEDARETAATMPTESVRYRNWRMALAVVLMAIAFGGTMFMGREQGEMQEGSARPLVVVAPFEPGDPAADPAGFGELAADWIARELARSGLLRVVPGSEAALRLDTGDVHGAVLAAAARSNADFLVVGDYHVEHDQLVAGASILDASTGQVLHALDPLRSAAATPTDVLDDLRRRVAGSLATRVDPRLSNWSTAASQPPSLETYREYAAGVRNFLDAYTGTARYESSMRAALGHFRAAGEAGDFPATGLWEAFALHHLGESEAVDSLLSTLQSRAETLPAWDAAMLEYIVAENRSDRFGAYRAMHRLAAQQPMADWAFWRGWTALRIGRAAEADSVLSGLQPERGFLREWPQYWRALMDARHIRGDFQGELEAARRARALHPGVWFPGEIRAHAARGDVERAAAAAALPGFDPVLRQVLLVRELRAHGHTRDARRVAAESYTRLVRNRPLDARHVVVQGHIGRLLLLSGDTTGARRIYEHVAREHPASMGRSEFEARLALLDVLAGDRTAADLTLERLRRFQPPPGTRGWEDWSAYKTACILGALGEPDEAMQALRRSFTLGNPFSDELHTDECLDGLRGHPPFEALLRGETGTD